MSVRRGIVACRAAPFARVESYALEAYALGRVSPRTPQGMGHLLERIVGPWVIDLVDVGVDAGAARMAFHIEDRSGPAPPFTPCDWVHILGRQSGEEMSMAFARACGMLVEWTHHERWPARLLGAVTLAIAMPEPAFRYEMTRLSVDGLGEAYVVPRACVLDRLKMFKASPRGEAVEPPTPLANAAEAENPRR